MAAGIQTLGDTPTIIMVSSTTQISLTQMTLPIMEMQVAARFQTPRERPSSLFPIFQPQQIKMKLKSLLPEAHWLSVLMQMIALFRIIEQVFILVPAEPRVLML